MRILSIIHIKGGVGKTISSINMAYIMAAEHGKRVLLVDNDKQGDASKMLNRHGYTHSGTAELMTVEDVDMSELIQDTDYENLDIITANMTLIKAINEVVIDQKRPQQTRFRDSLANVADQYDYCIIDNAPDLNMSTINALVAADDIMIPVTIDDFAIDGLDELIEQIGTVRKYFNPNLRLCGCFVTDYDRTNEADSQGEEYMKSLGYPVFNTHIRHTKKMTQSTFAKEPIILYSQRCGASADYKALVEEYISIKNIA